MYINIWPLIKTLIFILLLFMSIKYLISLKHIKIKDRKSIDYLIKRNTKKFFKNKYGNFNIHNEKKVEKVYNLQGDDVIRANKKWNKIRSWDLLLC